jgi:hypothetical protein
MNGRELMNTGGGSIRHCGVGPRRRWLPEWAGAQMQRKVALEVDGDHPFGEEPTAVAAMHPVVVFAGGNDSERIARCRLQNRVVRVSLCRVIAVEMDLDVGGDVHGAGPSVAHLQDVLVHVLHRRSAGVRGVRFREANRPLGEELAECGEVSSIEATGIRAKQIGNRELGNLTPPSQAQMAVLRILGMMEIVSSTTRFRCRNVLFGLIEN